MKNQGQGEGSMEGQSIPPSTGIETERDGSERETNVQAQRESAGANARASPGPGPGLVPRLL